MRTLRYIALLAAILTATALAACAEAGLTLPAQLTRIEAESFRSDAGITEVTIPDKCVYIGSYAFAQCPNLARAHIPSSVTTIEENAFDGCGALVIICDGGSAAEAYARTHCIPCAADGIVDEGAVGGLRWLLDGRGGLSVWGAGAVPGASASGEEDPRPWNQYASRISSVTLGVGITGIGARAFYEYSLRSVSLPNTLRTIGAAAFCYTNLRGELVIPDSVTEVGKNAFGGTFVSSAVLSAGMKEIPECCFIGSFSGGHLERVVIPEGIEEIGPNAFQQAKLTEVVLPSTIRTIGSGAFCYCPLRSVNIPEGVTSIGAFAFSECNLEGIQLPESLTYIGPYAFGWSGLSSVRIPGSVTDMTKAFKWSNYGYNPNIEITSNSLRSVTIDSGVTVISESAFEGSFYLKRVDLPATLERIEKKAFKDCKALEMLALPDSVESIGEQAFANCTRLVNIALPASVEAIDDSAFENCPHLTITAPRDSYAWSWAQQHGLLEKESSALSDFTYELRDGTYVITGYSGSDTDIVVPNRIEGVLVTGIAADVFKDQTANSIALPFALESIGDRAFYNCDGLTQLDAPVTVKSIGASAFYGCDNLTGMPLYEGLESIGDSAFAACPALLRMEVPDSVTALGDDFIIGDTALTYLKLGGGVPELTYNKTRLYSGRSNGNAYANEQVDPALKTVVIGEGVTAIGESLFSGNSYCIANSNIYVFNNCTYPNLESVSLPQSLETIGDGAFRETALTRVALGGNVTSIGNAAFRDCTALTTVSNFSSANIGNEAFYNCTSLDRIPLQSGIASIGNKAFYNCDALTSVSVPQTVTALGDGAFQDCDALAAVSLKEGLEHIGNSAFAGCPSLLRMEVPDSVTELGDDFINGDTALTYLKFGGGVPELTYDKTRLYSGRSSGNTYAYEHVDPALKTVVIGEGVTAIGESLFSGNYYCIANSNIYVFNNCTYPNLESVSLPQSLTSIGNGAFASATSLTGIVIPPNVTSIGSSAFQGCTALASVNIPAGVTAIEASTFQGCSVLEDVALPEGLATIAEKAFYECDGFENMSIPRSVTAIGDSAFGGCDGLTGIALREGLETIGVNAFANCTSLERMEVPDSVTELGNDFIIGDTALTYLKLGGGVPELTYNKTRLYSGRSSGNTHEYERVNPALKTVVIGEGVTAIGESLFSSSYYCIANSNIYVFNNCTYPNLESVSLPQSLETIGDGAFAGATSLTNYNIPTKLVSIGESAFKNCPGPRQLVLPKILARVEANAFNGCTNVETLVVQGEYTKMGVATFANETALKNASIASKDIKDSLYQNDANLGSVTFTKAVKSIGAHAFDGCANLTSVTFEKGVAKLTTIGDYAFNGCAKLTAFPFADATKLITVGNYAFAGCASMTKLKLQNVETIGNRAFYGCAGLDQVALPLTSLRSIGERAFAGLTKLNTFRVPESVYYVGARVIEGDTQLVNLSIQGGGVVDSNTYFVASAGACAVEELDIGSKASVIENNAFSGWTSLKAVHLSGDIIWIGDNAFSGCVNVNAPNEAGNRPLTLSLPAGLIYLGSGAFNGCDNWTSDQQIVVPFNVTALKANTFAGCKGITRLVLSSKVETIEESAFRDSQGVRLYVPSGSTAAQWCQEHYVAGTSKWSYYTYGSESAYYDTSISVDTTTISNLKVSSETGVEGSPYTATFTTDGDIQGVKIDMLRVSACMVEQGEYVVGDDGVSRTQTDSGYSWTIVFTPNKCGVLEDDFMVRFQLEGIDWKGNYTGKYATSGAIAVGIKYFTGTSAGKTVQGLQVYNDTYLTNGTDQWHYFPKEAVDYGIIDFSNGTPYVLNESTINAIETIRHNLYGTGNIGSVTSLWGEYYLNAKRSETTWTSTGLHEGIDLTGPSATAPIYSLTDGIVRMNGSGSLGIIAIEKDGYWVIYMHCSSCDVALGKMVTKGQKIGNQGNKANFNVGYHVHLSVYPASWAGHVPTDTGDDYNETYNGKGTYKGMHRDMYSVIAELME